jgi:error-prone DNA polymerase
MVERTHGDRPDLDGLRLDDPRVYDMICAPDTIGLFQIESRAQQQSLYQSQPREFNDLIVQVAIIRPGPIQGDAVHPYLRRRQGLEPVTYPHPSLEPILAETKGVILYQEQILRIVMEIAGYTAGEADRFRRAMNRHRSRLEMQSLRDEFIQRCLEHGGLDLDTAEQIFKSVAGFAQFGFCKSHAAAFARTAYETAWLRLEYPAHWLCALLNAQPMGFYHPSVLVEDAKRHGIRTLPVDVSRSRARCDVERADPADPALTDSERSAERAVHAACRELAGPHRGPRPRSPLLGAAMSEWAVRLGFNYVAGLGPAGRAACDAAVGAGANGSIADFWRHTKLTRPAMEQLIRCGAFDRVCQSRPRRELLWELTAIEEALPPRRRVRAQAQAEDLLATTLPGMLAPPRGRGHVAPPPATAPDPLGPLLEFPAPSPQLPAMNERDRVAIEYAVNEVSTGPHLIAFLRPALEALGCIPLARVPDCDDGARLRVAGLVIARQAPVSAKGFRFFTLADEGGHLDLVFMPRVAMRTRAVANFHPLLMVVGVLQADAGRLNLVVESVTGLDGEGRPVATRGPRTGPPHPGAGDSGPTTPGGPWKTPQAHNFR